MSFNGMSLACVALLCVLGATSKSSGQDAGVSGIPPGPGNARGLNGSVNDPSGIGNAARVPAIPPPAISPATVPTASPPAAYRSFPVQQGLRIRQPRLVQPRSRRAATANVRKQHSSKRHVSKQELRKEDTLLDSKMNICRGC